ncbi:MAG: FHA domain-containing protein, partial [Bacteriovorax sp.]|nr:FHA domain-containing protein [Bacteriovorax sp.]
AEHNSCLYNGEEFTRAELLDGDSLSVGRFTINIENSSDNTVEFTAAKEPASKESTNPEFSADKTFNSSSEEVSNPKLKPESDIDQNSTSELPDLSSESVEASNSIGEVTTEIELPSDFEAFDKPSTEEKDDFGYDENTEQVAEDALGLNSDAATEEGESLSEGDGNMSYSLESIDNGADENTKVIQSFSKVQLELFGDTAPYDRYLIESGKTFIGRDATKCQIVLNDSEVSTVHAVITKNNIQITLEDLNSSNGTILNGERTNKAILNHNDEFVIGGVTFTVKFQSDFLKEENSTLMAVDENQTVEVEEVVEVQTEDGESVDALGEMISNAPEEKSIIKRIWKDEQKRKKAIYAIVVLVGAWFMFGDDGGSKAPVASKKTKKTLMKNESGVSTPGKKLSEEERQALSARYEIGKNHYNYGRYREALDEFQKIASIDPNFNSSLQSIMALSKEGLSKLEEQERKRVSEQSSAEKKIKVKELIAKAQDYVKERRVELAQDIFNEIAKLDPENIELTRMKLELEDWLKEKVKKELEEASRKKAREDKVEKLKPGKNLFLQKEWFKSIGKLDDFLKLKDMDEDLIKEASEMLKTARDEIGAAVAPLTGKAKSLMEGQDLKGAYEVYQQILKIEPSNAEALNSTGDIKDILNNKAKKIYREAIISESLSLFQDAKEKFQEVQQVSPVDSAYYKKASDKLKDYLE